MKTKSLRSRSLRKRAGSIVGLQEHLERAEQKSERTEALCLARAIALAGLPKRRSRLRDTTRVLRLGDKIWLQVTYSAEKGGELPFGEDRFVLAGVQHLALEAGSPSVRFDRVGQLLQLFGVQESGHSLRLLRERFKRLAGLTIRLNFAGSKEALVEHATGEQVFIIRRYALPTRKDLEAEKLGQMVLAADPEAKEDGSPYGVLLSGDFWQYLQESRNQLIMPLELLKLFIDRPTGWDYACFLVSRCGSARQPSMVPHEALMSLFRDGEAEPDRKVIERLQRYHEEIMRATGGRLHAQLEEDGTFPSTGKGRPRKRWALRVGPSGRVVSSGRLLEAGPQHALGPSRT